MMEETRARLIAAARDAFARNGYAGTSMDDLTASVGLTRGALYHNFGDKRGLLAAVVEQIDGEMAAAAQAEAMRRGKSSWDRLLIVGRTYIESALDAEVRRIVLLDGPAVLGDPTQWPSQSKCLAATMEALQTLSTQRSLKPVPIEAAARLLNGAALNAALWVAGSETPTKVLSDAVAAFEALATGILSDDARRGVL